MTMELKTWTLHIACSHYEGLVEVASLLEKAFTIKGANSDFFSYFGYFWWGPNDHLPDLKTLLLGMLMCGITIHLILFAVL